MNFIGEPSLILFKKDIVKELDYFDDSLKQICDLEFALRVSSKYGLTYIPEQLCAFRIHYNSTTNKNITLKTFVLRYIEPLLFSHLLLHSKHYEAFRNNLNFLSLLKLNIYFQLKVYRANKINLIEAHDYPLFDESTVFYKEIGIYKKGNFFIEPQG